MPNPPSVSTDPDAATAVRRADRYRTLKRAGLVALCAAWALLGTVGHDPWKTEDATAFGVAWEMIRGGDPAVPRLAGEPFVERPPLAYAAAAATGVIFSPLLPLHDGARLAAAAILGLTLLLLAATAKELHGREWRWTVVLLFIGSVGLWDRAHQLSPELGLLLGVATALYGFALTLRRPAAGGALVGLGAAIAFLSRGFLGPVWIALTALALPAAFSGWRTREYAIALAVAVAVAVPLGAAWPLALIARAPEHLVAWWALQTPAEFFAPLARHPAGDPLYIAKNLPWFAFPALPLVLWTLWIRGRGFSGGLARPVVQLSGTLAVVMIVVVAAMAEPRAIVLMPLLLPLALLGALEIDTLRRDFSGALDWFGILTFGLASALVWWLWFDTWAHGMAPTVARLFRDTEAGYRPPSFPWTAFVVSAAMTLVWLLLVRPARRSNRRAVLNWAVGMTLLWALFTTIWLPYLDSRRSYRIVAEDLRGHLPQKSCVASRNLGDAQRALFHYYAGLATVREEKAPTGRCNALLVQYGRQDAGARAPAGWQPVWEGRRRGDDTERYVLYLRKPK